MSPPDSGSNTLLPDLSLDGHVHTKLCNHAVGEMEEYVNSALAKNLHTIIFLEHLEVGIESPERTWLTETDFEYYFQEGCRLQEKYASSINIKLGVETGYNAVEIPRLREVLHAYPWDHRGLSHHFYHDPLKGHINMVSRRPENISALEQIGPDKVLQSYFSGLARGVEELEIDVLCHLDAVLRHYPGLTLRQEHWKMIEKLLEVLATNHVALEINTSGFPIRGEPFPQPRIIESALRKNIRLIAGSDAHKPEQIARYFERLPDIFHPLLAAMK